MRKVWPAKAPGETLKYAFNWSPRNIGNSRITAPSVQKITGTVVIGAITVEDVPNARPGQGVTYIISGGVNGEMNELLLKATLDTGELLEQTVFLPIRQK